MSGWGAPREATPQSSSVIKALRAAGQETGDPFAPSTPLPLPEIDWGQTIEPGELVLENSAEWPPARVRQRSERLELYHDLFRGDVSALTDPRRLAAAHVGPVNVFRRVITFVADLLVREAPTTGDDSTGPLSASKLTRLAHTAAVNAMRHGQGFVFTYTAEGGEPILKAPDSRYVWPTTEGGWIIAEPRNTPENATELPDALVFTILDNEGSVVTITRKGQPARMAGHVSMGSVTGASPAGSGGMMYDVPALPMQGDGWGTSWIDDLITICIQVAVRMAANAVVLDDNSAPLLLIRGDMDRYTVQPGVATSAAVKSPTGGDVANEQEVARRLARGGPLILPDGVEGAEYVTWEGSLEWSIAQLDQLGSQFRFLSGVPNVLDADAEIPSGMSLRRMFWQFDARVATLFRTLHGALTEAVGAHGATLEWENAFEVIEETPLADSREDVEDEETARRGEGDEPQG